MYKLKLTKDFKLTINKKILKLEGKLGYITMLTNPKLKFRLQDDTLYISTIDFDKVILNGFLSLFKKHLKGINQGYKKQLQLVGVGFKWFIRENILIKRFKLKINYLIVLKVKHCGQTSV